jgi:hypothetical protein
LLAGTGLFASNLKSHSQRRERALLANILGRLGSDQGERDAAALAAMPFMRQRGIVWPQVIGPVSFSTSTTMTAADDLGTWPRGWRGAAQFCIRNAAGLTEWEKGFCKDIVAYVGEATEQQQVIPRKLVDKIVAAEMAS